MAFELTTLGEYARVQGGYAYKSKDFSSEGVYPVLKIKNVRFGYVDYSDVSFIDEEVASQSQDWKTREGDILISMTGSGPNAPQSLVGRVARVWSNEPEAWINQRVGRVVLKEEGAIHPDFIFYLLSSSRSQDYLVSNSSGSANQANISGKIIESLPCPRVSYDESSRIAKLLRELDLKILTNRQTNQTLEQIAQAIFKSWFVDFEPTRAKAQVRASVAQGRMPGSDQDLPADFTNKDADQLAERAAMAAISGKTQEEIDQLAQVCEGKEAGSDAASETNAEGALATYKQLKAIAALFPDALVDSELGEIPEGWEVKPLYETAEYINGNAFKANDFSSDGGGVPIIKIVELKNGISGSTKFTTGSFPEKYYVQNGDVLYSWSGSPETSLEVFKWFGGNGWLNQHIFKLNFKSDDDKCFVYYLLKHMKPVLISTAQQKQTTGLGHITVADMKRLLVASPNERVLRSFGQIITPIYSKCSCLAIENIALSKIRDEILPKLLSGEISLKGYPLVEAVQC